MSPTINFINGQITQLNSNIASQQVQQQELNDQLQTSAAAIVSMQAQILSFNEDLKKLLPQGELNAESATVL